MKKLLALLAVVSGLSSSSFADTYKTIFNPFTSKPDYVTVIPPGGGSSVYPATATASFPYGLSASTAVIANTIGATGITSTVSGATGGLNQLAFDGSMTCNAGNPQNGFGGRYDVQGTCSVASYGLKASNNSSSPTNYGADLSVTGGGTTAYGLNVSLAGTPTGTSYGIRVANGGGATTNYGLYMASGQSVFVDSVTVLSGAGALVRYNVTAGSLTVNGSGAGQIRLVAGSSTTVEGVGSSAGVFWMDQDTDRVMLNNAAISSSAVMVTPEMSGLTWQNTTGGIYVSSTTEVNISTKTYINVYWDLTQANFLPPERTVAQIAACVPKTNGCGTMFKCTDCAATVNICTSTGTAKGAYALITNTGTACQ